MYCIITSQFMRLFYLDCNHIMRDPEWVRTYDAIRSDTSTHPAQLTLVEQTRIKSLRDPIHQAQQTISFMTQYHALTIYAGDTQQIIREPNTKPRCGNPVYHFNTSHSGEHVVVCVDTVPCGVDIECVYIEEALPRTAHCTAHRTISRYPQIMYDTFGIDNQIPLQSFHPPEKAVRLWTQTEAWLKFVGCGLRGLGHMGIVPSNDGFVLTHHGFPVPRPHDISGLLPDNVFGTVFTDGSNNLPMESISKISFSDLFE